MLEEVPVIHRCRRRPLGLIGWTMSSRPQVASTSQSLVIWAWPSLANDSLSEMQ